MAQLRARRTCAHAALADADAAAGAICLGRRGAAHPCGWVARAGGALALSGLWAGGADAQVNVCQGRRWREGRESAWL